MTENSKTRADEVTDVVENSSSEIALDDLEASANVIGGHIPDVTLKRGVIG